MVDVPMNKPAESGTTPGWRTCKHTWYSIGSEEGTYHSYTCMNCGAYLFQDFIAQTESLTPPEGAPPMDQKIRLMRSFNKRHDDTPDVEREINDSK